MEHDLIRSILSDKIDGVQSRIDSYRDSITKLEEDIALSREFLDNGNTKSYFVCRAEVEMMGSDRVRWCEANLGYSPVCMFVEKHTSSDSRSSNKRMVVLFKDDADLSAYKLMFT